VGGLLLSRFKTFCEQRDGEQTGGTHIHCDRNSTLVRTSPSVAANWGRRGRTLARHNRDMLCDRHVADGWMIGARSVVRGVRPLGASSSAR